MNTIKLTLVAAMIGASAAAMAADPAMDSSRQDRMDSAYQDYRNGSSSNASMHNSDTKSQGRFARAEDSMKRGASKTGNAIENGARKVGHAIGNGARKTKDAIKRTGEKMGGSSDADHKQVEP
jgi:Ni/Co efflux regulator RcnB